MRPRASKSTRRQIISSCICLGLRTEQAFLSLILRLFCFRFIFSCLLVSAFTFFSIIQETRRSFKSCNRAFKDSTVFAALHSQRHALWLAKWCKIYRVYIQSHLMVLLLFTNIFIYIQQLNIYLRNMLVHIQRRISYLRIYVLTFTGYIHSHSISSTTCCKI